MSGIPGSEALEETASPAGEPIPADHLCARCGYPSGRSGSQVCPECGWRATAVELHAAAARREAVARWQDGGRFRAAQRWVIVIVAYALGAAVVARDASAAVGALVSLGSFVAIASWAGATGAWRCRRDRREFLRVVWSRSLWMLHLPWLVAPVFVGAAIFVGMIDLWAGDRGGGVYLVAVVAGFVMWLFGCLGAFVAWWRARLRVLAEGGFRLGRADAAAFFLGLGVLAGAAALGFLAGATVALGVAEWLGFGVFAT